MVFAQDHLKVDGRSDRDCKLINIYESLGVSSKRMCGTPIIIYGKASHPNETTNHRPSFMPCLHQKHTIIS